MQPEAQGFRGDADDYRLLEPLDDPLLGEVLLPEVDPPVPRPEELLLLLLLLSGSELLPCDPVLLPLGSELLPEVLPPGV
jgi:hypothetical protein